jgi:hypothetical protein
MARTPKTFDDPLVLEAALEGLELQKKRIEAQMAEIRIRLGKRAIAGAAIEPRKRDLSAEARKRIGAAQKKRWAEYRKVNANPK